MADPIAFVSYSHDSSEHKAWVRQLAGDLRGKGIDAILDQYRLEPGQDVVAFMEGSIAAADRVLLICTEAYVDRADGREGGVGYESLVVTGELVLRIDTKKFIPIIRQTTKPRRMPRYLGPRKYIDFSDDADYSARLDELVATLHQQTSMAEPPLGASPFGGVPPAPSPARAVSMGGSMPSGRSVTHEPWFASQLAVAEKGLKKIGRSGAMEIRAALHEPITKSQIELLNAVRRSEIRTFGWPIGALLEGIDEHRPRPTNDGIVAEVLVPEKTLSGTSSYDYWTVRTSGDFYLLQSLFEDERAKNAIFFNTRIVRVTESFLFLANLYQNLGIPLESRVTVGVTHLGLKGRTLTAVGNRHVFERATASETAEAQITDTIQGLRDRTMDHVMQILEPMFMLFDFASFGRPIYEDIVTKFKAGHVT